MSFDSNKFQKGQGGRQRGARNRLSHSFLEALEAEFNESGRAALKICAKEEPTKFVQLVAGLMPRELQVETTHLMEMPDDELTAVIEHIRQQLAQRTLIAGERSTETTH